MPRRALGERKTTTFTLRTSYFLKRQQPKESTIRERIKITAPLGTVTDTIIPILTPITKSAHPTPLHLLLKLTTSTIYYA